MPFAEGVAKLERIRDLFKLGAFSQDCVDALYSLVYHLALADKWIEQREKWALEAIRSMVGNADPLDPRRAVETIRAHADPPARRAAYDFLHHISNADSLSQRGEERLLALCRKEWSLSLGWRRGLEVFIHGDPVRYCIIGVIAANALLIGLETSRHSPLLHLLQSFCLLVFALELTLKCIAAGPRKFFLNKWNLFDIAVTAPGFIPAASSAFTVLRLIRIIRIFQVLKFIGKYPDFRLTVEVLFRACKAMVPLGILLAIFIYVYAIVGMELFGAADPHYASLREAIYTLFSALTYQSWGDLRAEHIQTHGFWIPTLYYASWVVVDRKSVV
jgi:voltage-gated sodium channel